MQPSEIYKLQNKKIVSEKEDAKMNLDYLLSFEIQGSRFAVDFDRVQEVVEAYPYAEYPESCEGHLGIINLRGNVVPIISPWMHQNIILEGSKYIIFETENGNLVGFMAGEVKKIEVPSSEISDVTNEKIISISGGPVRYLKTKTLLKNYEDIEVEAD